MNLRIRNFEGTQMEVLSGMDKASFYTNEQKNETWEIGFDVYRTRGNQVAFDLVTYESSVFWGGQEFVIKEMIDGAEGKKLFKSVIAVHISYTAQDGYQYDTVTGTLSINQCLNHIFAPDPRGFTFQVLNINGVIPRKELENFGDANYLWLINKVISDFDVVLIPNNKHLVFVPKIYYGEKTNNVIRHKYNTDEVSFEIDTYNLKTQIRGFGKRKETEDGEPGDYYFPPITFTSPQINKWGLRIADPVRDERFTIPANMARRLREELQDYPEIVGHVKLSLEFGGGLGDYVRFVYEPTNINEFIQIAGIKEWLFDRSKPPEITLSNTRQTMTSFMVALAAERR